MSDISGVNFQPQTSSYQDGRVVSKSLSQSDFLKVMTAQLAKQDPFKAADSSKFMEDFMTMGNFQAIQEMTANMKVVQQQQATLLAQSLVGRTVEVQKKDGSTEQGVISQASASGSDVNIKLGTQTYSSKDIVNVINQTAAAGL